MSPDDEFWAAERRAGVRRPHISNLPHKGKEVTWEDVDFSDMNSPMVAHVFSQLGGWRPHDPIVLVKKAFLLVPKEKGMWN